MRIDYIYGMTKADLYYSNWRECSRVKNLKFDRVKIGQCFYGWEMHLAHEIGHILHYHHISNPKPTIPKGRTDIQTFRQEVVAWRIAKSITLPKLWDEREAIECLKTYTWNRLKIRWNKLKIIAWASK